MEDINIAMLVDADNISAKYITEILSELSKYGKITVRRMYGDWSQDRLHSWLAKASSFSLTPVMQPNNTPGKNASDIGLIIDAMDILYTGDVQGFCIVSSDGDFNKLATRLRESGKTVIGMGEKKTPESFRVSCERFIFLDIDEDEDLPAQTAGKAKSSTRKKAAAATVSASASKKKKTAAVAEPAVQYVTDPMDKEEASGEPSFTDQATIENAIVKMIIDNNADGKETGLGEIGSRLVKIFPDFDIRNYHYSKLSEYLADFPSLQVTNRDNAVWVSLKSSSDSEIETQIRRIFERHNTDEINIDVLKSELQELNPNLNASIRKSGVTRFSVYLNREIHSVEVNGSRVTLLH
ncbi:MAG: NYN domain-containing protein [Lachnospiraceae bacterium]|nr:NYN domain-containing protein [Lachnospiraceae bacterium]